MNWARASKDHSQASSTTRWRMEQAKTHQHQTYWHMLLEKLDNRGFSYRIWKHAQVNLSLHRVIWKTKNCAPCSSYSSRTTPGPEWHTDEGRQQVSGQFICGRSHDHVHEDALASLLLSVSATLASRIARYKKWWRLGVLFSKDLSNIVVLVPRGGFRAFWLFIDPRQPRPYGIKLRIILRMKK